MKGKPLSIIYKIADEYLFFKNLKEETNKGKKKYSEDFSYSSKKYKKPKGILEEELKISNPIKISKNNKLRRVRPKKIEEDNDLKKFIEFFKKEA